MDQELSKKLLTIKPSNLILNQIFFATINILLTYWFLVCFLEQLR